MIFAIRIKNNPDNHSFWKIGLWLYETDSQYVGICFDTVIDVVDATFYLSRQEAMNAISMRSSFNFNKDDLEIVKFIEQR